MADGLDCALVLGGDGTVLTVATGLLGHDVPLEIIPLGTAHRVTIDTRKSRRINALNDGEPVRLRTPLRDDILTHALPVLMPIPAPAHGHET